MAEAKKGKEKEAMKDEARPPGEAMERFKRAMRHIVSVPKTEIDRRARKWQKSRRRKAR